MRPRCRLPTQGARAVRLLQKNILDAKTEPQEASWRDPESHVDAGSLLTPRPHPHHAGSGAKRANEGGHGVKVDGGYQYGSITFEAEIDPAAVAICHCTDCQRLSGTAFRVVVRLPVEKFTLVSGAPGRTSRPPKAAPDARRCLAPRAVHRPARRRRETARRPSPGRGHPATSAPLEAPDTNLAPLGAGLDRGDRLDPGKTDQ